ncbi:MAG TPA: DinB family protein, partial [Ktedonobacteraceae bacterium]|nr:DinB family protein [Ktedonobacteraceae bacterium]
MAQVENPLEKVRRKMVNARIEFLGQLAKFSREELQKHPVIGEWSPLELAYHLYIADGLAIEQMRLIQSEDNPQLPALAKLAPTQTNTNDVPDSL